jgi:hypothetical protein
MTNPGIAMACLVIVVLTAAFFVVDARTSCQQQHGPDYRCIPSGRNLVR